MNKRKNINTFASLSNEHLDPIIAYETIEELRYRREKAYGTSSEYLQRHPSLFDEEQGSYQDIDDIDIDLEEKNFEKRAKDTEESEEKPSNKGKQKRDFHPNIPRKIIEHHPAE